MYAQWAYGACLTSELRQQVLARFINRYTGEHRPSWVTRGGHASPPLYATDLEWLHNTEFAIRADGQLDGRVKHCMSHPPRRALER